MFFTRKEPVPYIDKMGYYGYNRGKRVPRSLGRPEMLKRFVILSLLFFCVAVLLVLMGCETDAQNTGLLGSGIGVGVAAIAGGEGRDLLTGAAIGGGAGYILGNESDKKKARARTDQQTADLRSGQDIVSVMITNSNGSQSEVKLRRSGLNYIGPRGEVYQTMPTEDQLRQVYGF